ncbi:filamentous hemagglutinin N-terminal domain-containing protein [Oscillatoria acuminata]|uniref:Filamentous hemagglutinin family N-terminal domain protein n=1 Tax=Oscillatoria acuminata PCC 6304 TaxID=56110 RepID=K9TEM6_9CYAN|nr:filamentous hemagglutinin N-terminal domain-containing protein [Oscillatoria acuminata]AFY80469.1 filamentous hemagglutinin family N-terminal domain protein [Oscillatoria acuminata PCC 6304]
MPKSNSHSCIPGIRQFTVALFCLGGIATTGPSHAQIIPDTTLPINSLVTPNGAILTIDGGTASGGNLFHSFEQFNLPTGGTAWFNNALEIQNIFTRITGGGSSTIDGLIQANGIANLFLLNPNGIMFGPNATLNLGGSFVVSTANGFTFADGSEFRATGGQVQTPLLSVTVPVGLQYGSNPRGIEVQGSSLLLQPGQTLALGGSEIAIASGQLRAPGGLVALNAVGSEGVTALNWQNGGVTLHQTPTPETPNPRGDIALTNNSVLSVISNDGGDISLQGRNIQLSGGSQIIAGIQTQQGGPNAQGGEITLDATGGITLTQGSAIGNQVGFNSTGNGGNVTIRGQSLFLSEGSQLSAVVKNGGGNAGQVVIQVAEGLTLTGTRTGIFSLVELGLGVRESRRGEGNSGGIEIQAGTIALTNGAQLQSITQNDGNAGRVAIRTTDGVSLSGAGTAIFNAVGQTGMGNSEGIEIAGRSLVLSDGAQVISQTQGIGNAGKIVLQVRELVSLMGSNTSIFNTSAGNGNTDGIEMNTGTLSMTGGAQIQAVASGLGNAGPVKVNANDAVTLQGVRTGILSTVASEVIEGNSGGIDIQARSLSLSEGAQLVAATFGRGNAGPVSIQVREDITLTGANTVIFSSVGPIPRVPFSFTGFIPTIAQGNSGGIQMTGRSLLMSNGAQIVGSTFDSQQGNAGNIQIQMADRISLQGNNNQRNPNASEPIVSVTPVTPLSLVEELDVGLIDPAIPPIPPTPGEPTPPPVFPPTPPPPSVIGEAGKGATTGIFTTVETDALGNAGSINLQSRTLEVSQGAQIQTLTRGRGNSGDIQIQVSNAVLTGVNTLEDFSGLASTVEAGALGNAGDIQINADNLAVTGGAGIQALTRGTGDSGEIRLNVTQGMTVSGRSPDGSFPSGIFSSTEEAAQGSGGGLTIATDRLQVSDGAVLSARSTTAFPSGEIGVSANRIDLSRDSQILTSATGEGAAGSITLTAGEQVTLSDRAVLSSETASGDRGNITLRSPDLILRNNSQITTNATGTGTGGNIILNTDNIVAINNSNITANSEQSSGGQVIINTQGLFGAQARRIGSPNTSDITATSAQGPQFDGIVEVNRPEVDPTSGLVDLPENLVDLTNVVVQNCAAENTHESSLVMTGKGGLPPSPNDAIAPESILIDLGHSQGATGSNSREGLPRQWSATGSNLGETYPELVEARGWSRDNQGKIKLVAPLPIGEMQQPFGIASPQCNP